MTYPVKSPRKLIEVALPLDAVSIGYTDFQNIAPIRPFRRTIPPTA